MAQQMCNIAQKGLRLGDFYSFYSLQCDLACCLYRCFDLLHSVVFASNLYCQMDSATEVATQILLSGLNHGALITRQLMVFYQQSRCSLASSLGCYLLTILCHGIFGHSLVLIHHDPS